MDEDAIVRTYRETIGPLYAYVSRRVGGDRSLAEDLVQDAWMRALDYWPANGMPDEPLAWLTRVAHNTLVSHFRRSQPQSMDPAAIDRLFDDSQASAGVADAAVIVSWGLSRLRRPHAELLEAFYFGEKSVRDIARARSTSERAIEGRLRRARAKLKKVLERIKRRPAAQRAQVEEGTSRAEHSRTS